MNENEEEKKDRWPSTTEALYVGTATRTQRRWKRSGSLSLFGKTLLMPRNSEEYYERQLRLFVEELQARRKH